MKKLCKSLPQRLATVIKCREGQLNVDSRPVMVGTESNDLSAQA